MSDVEKPDYFEEPETHIDKQKIMTELKQKIANEKTNDELREEIKLLDDIVYRLTTECSFNKEFNIVYFGLDEWQSILKDIAQLDQSDD